MHCLCKAITSDCFLTNYFILQLKINYLAVRGDALRKAVNCDRPPSAVTLYRRSDVLWVTHEFSKPVLVLSHDLYEAFLCMHLPRKTFLLTKLSSYARLFTFSFACFECDLCVQNFHFLLEFRMYFNVFLFFCITACCMYICMKCVLWFCSLKLIFRYRRRNFVNYYYYYLYIFNVLRILLS